jgi:K+-transporting ATPase A subunit
MRKNMGLIDKLIRLALAIVVAVLIFTGQLSGAAAIILGIFAAVFVGTSLIGSCPLYLPFKIDTRGKKAGETK